MRILTLCLVAGTVALGACATTKFVAPIAQPAAAPKPIPTSAYISGTIDNAKPGDSVSIVTVLAGQSRRHRSIVASTKIQPGGSFALTVRGLSAPASAQLQCAPDFLTIFLTPGDSLALTANKKDLLGTLRFTGRGAAGNNYLTQAQRRYDINWAAQPEKQSESSNPAEMQRLVASRYQQQLAMLDSAAAGACLSDAFIRSRRQVLAFHRMVSLMRYANYVRHQTKQEPTLPADFFAGFADLPLRDLDVYTCEPAVLQGAVNLMSAYENLRLLAPNGQLPTGPNTGEKLYAQLLQDFGDAPAVDQMMGSVLRGQLFGPARDRQEPVLAVLPAFWANTRDSAAVQGVRRALRLTARLGLGQPAPAFKLHDATGKEVALADFRGKVVYLDFWYSNCAPCLAEAPAATTLKKRFAGRDVVFLYISVDSKADLWQRTISKHQLGGPNSVHLLDVRGNTTVGAYSVGSFPSYWIIGRDGRIIQGAAPRPSQGAATVAALEQALKATP